MIADIIAWILIAVMVWWIGSSVVSIVKSIKKKLRSRGSAPEEAQNTNTEKECDQSNSADVSEE